MLLGDKSPGEYTDEELNAAIRVVTGRRDELAAEGDAELAARMADVLGVLLYERDARRGLGPAVESALWGGEVLWQGQVVDSQDERLGRSTTRTTRTRA